MKDSQVSELSTTAYLIAAVFAHGGASAFLAVMCLLSLAHLVFAERKEMLEDKQP